MSQLVGKNSESSTTSCASSRLHPRLSPSSAATDRFSQFYLGLPFASLSIPRSNIFLPGREQSGPIPPFDFLGVAILAVFLAVLPSTSSNA
ncbi:MAG: hypothetical protein KDJ29_19350 [Hyphomicrobiales bacterium]|uniref:hypothetical protein n=1 Tax=Roseibium album TaxID=311410 RepID=UPI0032ED73A5|nr:hypothetical protein [Hyphomicrobiales bacterium]